MMPKASVVVVTLAISLSAGAAARAETACPTAHKTAHHPAHRATTRTVIVEEHYSHTRRAPAPPYYGEPGPPPDAYGAPDDYYEPILTSYGYGYGYGGYGGYGRPSGWYRHTGGGANWNGARAGFVGPGPRPYGQVVAFGGGSVGMGGRGGVIVGGMGRR